MWRSKKVIIGTVLIVMILAGSIGGIVLAADGDDDSQAVAPQETLLDRVTEILAGEGINITSEQLKDAFAEAQNEMQIKALQNRLQAQVDEGKITQDEADQYLEWWQARPDIGIGGFGFRGHGGFPGMGGGRCWGRMGASE